MASTHSDQEIREILKTCRRIAVVGLSPVPARPSHSVTRYLIRHGYEIYGVRPAAPPEILGRPCVERLSDLPNAVDLIDVFRNSEAIPGFIDELETWLNALPKSSWPKALWLQEGVTHEVAEARAGKLGLFVISDRCILSEHARLL